LEKKLGVGTLGVSIKNFMKTASKRKGDLDTGAPNEKKNLTEWTGSANWVPCGAMASLVAVPWKAAESMNHGTRSLGCRLVEEKKKKKKEVDR